MSPRPSVCFLESCLTQNQCSSSSSQSISIRWSRVSWNRFFEPQENPKKRLENDRNKSLTFTQISWNISQNWLTSRKRFLKCGGFGMFWDVLGAGCWTAVERCRGPEPSVDCAEFDRWLVIKNDPCCTLWWTTFCHGKSPCLMGKSTISMAIFHCYVNVHQRVPCFGVLGRMNISHIYKSVH